MRAARQQKRPRIADPKASAGELSPKLSQELAELRRLHGDSDGLGTRPLRATSDFVLHYLPLIEFLDGHSLERRVMEEQVVAPIPFDEPKTSIRNQPLDFTLWHFCSPT